MRTLKKGDRGEDVKQLQESLHLLADGIFGKMTEEAVKEHQRRYGLVADGIVGPKTWATLEQPSVLKLRSKRRIDEIIVHCTATKEGVPVSVEQVRQWHRKRGFADIGYHYLVGLDGVVHAGRDVDLVGAHCTGHNARSIGVCYVGGLDKDGNPKDTRTGLQHLALIDLLTNLKKVYPRATIHGHREFANKACPCFDAYKEYKGL